MAPLHPSRSPNEMVTPMPAAPEAPPSETS